MIDRRHILALAGGAAIVGVAGVLAWPRPALGFGPVTLRQPRAAALERLGPGALASELCGGVDGTLYSVRDPGFETENNESIPVMAMFGAEDGSVSEISASLSWPNGGISAEDWHKLVTRQEAELLRRIVSANRTASRADDDLALETETTFTHADAIIQLHSRWMRRSGAAFSRLHWIAAGQKSVIV